MLDLHRIPKMNLGQIRITSDYWINSGMRAQAFSMREASSDAFACWLTNATPLLNAPAWHPCEIAIKRSRWLQCPRAAGASSCPPASDRFLAPGGHGGPEAVPVDARQTTGQAASFRKKPSRSKDHIRTLVLREATKIRAELK